MPFPNESAAYRASREELLRAELDLRRQIERVAAMRRGLPLGGEVPEDYEFVEDGPSGERGVKLSELFAKDRDTLLLYSFMYGPKMERPCPYCTSFLDALDASVRSAVERVQIVVTAKSPIARIRAYASGRGWSRLRLVSWEKNTYGVDYMGEVGGKQLPMMNVFVRREGKTFHTWGSEMLFGKDEEGQDARHIDSLWPIWNLLDLTPAGRAGEWALKP